MTKCDEVSGVTKYLDGITYTELSFLHICPLLYLHISGRGLTKFPPHPFKDVKGFQRKEGEKSSRESLCKH